MIQNKECLVLMAVFIAYFQVGRSSYATYGSEISLMNIDKVWAQNITGRNVTVAVVDDGINYNHQDLNANYDATVSHDFVTNDSWPMPNHHNAHGTKCAGTIAARLHGTCRTGVAYNANLAGIRIFDGRSVEEIRNAAGFGYKKNKIDIYSNSWGPPDNGYSIKGPGTRESEALNVGINHGREGLGSIFVFASGNGGLFGDSCAFDGYVNNINTIAIGAFSQQGVQRYTEYCSSVMAAAYGDYVKTCSGNSRCVTNFGRTSAAAAFASGIIALLLEANNKLTQRDIQHLIVRTSNPKMAKISARKWIVNGAGLLVHPAVGFGVLDAKKLIDVARNGWTTVPQRQNCSNELNNLPQQIVRGGTNFTFSFGKTKDCSNIERIEHVEVKVSLSFSPRAIMEMYVISPYGTKSQLLYMRLFDSLTSREYYKGLVVASLHFWGENPEGDWTVLFKSAEDMSSHGRSRGTLHELKVTFYGTKQDPLSENEILPKGKITCGGRDRFWKGYGTKCCGSLWVYNPEQEICCPGSYEIVKKNSKCGSKTYNKCNQICCSGNPREKLIKSVLMSCCGEKSYDKKSEICCNGEVHKKFICDRWFVFAYERKCSSNGRVWSVNTGKRCMSRHMYG